MKTKTCVRCKQDKALDCFSKRAASTDGKHYYCKPCESDKQKAFYVRNGQKRRDYQKLYKQKYPEKIRERRLAKYGLTVDIYNRMFEAQGGLCAICETPDAGGRYNVLHVDHDHQTGRVRALLCHHCNTALGKLQDSPTLLRLAANYIEYHKEA